MVTLIELHSLFAYIKSAVSQNQNLENVYLSVIFGAFPSNEFKLEESKTISLHYILTLLKIALVNPVQKVTGTGTL